MAETAFELVNDHLFVRASVDGVPADLIVDTGSSLSTLSEGFAARTGVRLLEGYATAAGAASVPVRLGRVRSLALGPLDLGDAVVALVPTEAVSRAEGRTVDGSLGIDLFQRHAVEIDYAARRLTAREPGSLAPADRIAVPIDARTHVPLVEADLETREGVRIRARLVVDLGSSSLALRLAASFVERHAAAFAGLRGLDVPIGTGVGGRLMGTVVRLRSLRLGDLEVASPVAGLSREKKGALEAGFFHGSIGVPVLKPWVGIDYRAGRLFLHPRAGSDASHDASGLTLTSDGEAILVDFVAAPSPAREAGLRPGDALRRLDGEAVGARDLDRVRRSLREPGATRILDVERLGSVPLPLRALV